MNTDGISYLDIASEAVQGGPGKLVNGYWSPGYPALIAVALLIFQPSRVAEFPLIHFVNLFLYLFALCTFTLFLKFWLASRRAFSPEETDPIVIPFAFGLFLFFMTHFVRVERVTPDLFVAGVVFLAAAVCYWASLPGSPWWRFVVFGTILGVGYYVKTVMFPAALILITALLLWPPSWNRNRVKVLLTGLVFLMVAAPLVILISGRVGRLSIGEAGWLTYAWYVNRIHPFVGWTGGDNGLHGAPEEPPRILLDDPRVLEFAEPVGGTYPLWYEPSYWYSGAKVRFNFREQLAALITNLRVYWQGLAGGSLLGGAVVLWIVGIRQRIFPALERVYRWQLVWPIAVCLMYAAIHVERRFVGAFLVLAWLALYSYLWRGVPCIARTAVLGTVLCSLLIPAAEYLARVGAGALRETRSDPPERVIVGQALQAAGVVRGDRIASVGHATRTMLCDARYAGVRIVAEVFPAGRPLDVSDLGRVSEALAAVGVKALVSENEGVTAIPHEWGSVTLAGSRRVSIVLLNASAGSAK